MNNTELQHGHSVSTWQDYGNRGADASRRGRASRREECPTCHHFYTNLKKHACKGPEGNGKKKSSRRERCACGRSKHPDAEKCPHCGGTASEVEQEMAKSRKITIEQLRKELYG